jgi:superfamily II DNA or RNA helicase
MLIINQRDYATQGTRAVYCYMQDGDWIWVPRAFAFAEYTGTHDFVDRRSDGTPLTGCEFTAQLGVPPHHAKQPDFVAAMVKGTLSNGFGGFGIAPCGAGKTLLGTRVAIELGGSTLIVVNKEYLAKQWRETIESFVRINGEVPKVGTCQQSTCEFGPEYPFCIATVQSLAQRDYPEDFYKSWRTVVFDEAHHTPANSYFQTINRLCSRYVVGVTATLRRKDNMEAMFSYSIGQPLYIMRRAHVDADVQFAKWTWAGVDFEAGKGRTLRRTVVHGHLSKNPQRNAKIVDLIVKAHSAGRKTLLLSHLRQHLTTLRDALPEDIKAQSSFYVGATKQAVLDEAAKARIIFGTYAMADEGLDIKDIDCLILATPTGDIEQAAGRVLRHHPDKMRPLIVDIVDVGVNYCEERARQRYRYFRESNFTLRNTP